MNEQKNILIIFTEKADKVLSDIILKYNLGESSAEVFEKYKANKLPRLVLLDHLARDFTLQIISEKDLANSLQKELSVPFETAEKISKDIINNLAPLLDKVTEDQLEAYNNKNQPASQFQPAQLPAIEKDLDVFPKISPTKEAEKTKTIPSPSPIQKTKNSLPATEKSVAPRKQQEGPDKYRETVE